MAENNAEIKAIIGLGNPGNQYRFTRHNIGFLVLDALNEKYHGSWKTKDILQESSISLNGHTIVLIKPQTFMNSSGKVIPLLAKQGIKPEHILVVHDELEKPFGSVSIKCGGSARGHNGLRSIIEACGDGFWRLRCGIARPEKKEEVGNYVLQNFSEPQELVQKMIEGAVGLIEERV